MEKGKCKQVILGNFSKVASPGSDSDVIRTCFLGHILLRGGNMAITVPLSQVLYIFIIYNIIKVRGNWKSPSIPSLQEKEEDSCYVL